ncbi:MAG: hypothetical protein KC777_03745 [Cyanobacteria bacterium HKST-UBA02]|nr:hypothetical protein [Cyanobacteria bacterium HKST-UBA02]
MFRKATVITTVTVVALLSGVLTVTLMNREKPSITEGAFGSKLTRGVELPAGSESIRIIDFWPDGITRKQGTEYNQDGSISHYWFREDGTLRHATTLGPAGDDGKRPTIRVTDMAPDGRTFESDTEWYASGAMKKLVKLESDGNTSRQFYFENGQLDREQQMVLAEGTWKLASESAFRADGTKSRTFLVGDKETTDMLFNEHEVAIVVKVHNKKLDQYTERWYEDDGKTLKRAVDQNDQGTLLAVKGEGGVDRVTYDFSGNMADGMLEVTFFDEHGVKVATQSWWVIEGKRVLRAVMFFDKDGKWDRQYLIEVSGAGAGKIERDTKFGGMDYRGNYTSRNYAPDGTLKSVNVYGPDGKQVSETTHNSQESIGPEIDPRVTEYKLFELSIPETPPQAVEYVPQGD